MMLRISERAGGNVRVHMRELFVNDDGVFALVKVDVTPKAKLRGVVRTPSGFERTVIR